MNFTVAEIVRAFSGLLTPLAEQSHAIHLRSDIAPNMIADTGVWADFSPPGDENAPASEFIGFLFVVKDAVDADTKEPFVAAIKVHRPSFEAAPKVYSMGLVMNLAKGLGKMETEMHNTASKEAKRLRAEMAKMNTGDILH